MKLTIRQLRKLISEVADPSGKDIVAIYAGRFQPMGKHHKSTYDWMVNEFGYDNSYVVSSDKTCPPKSPLCFIDKLEVAKAHGIPEDKFILEKSPYVPSGLLSKYDPETTSVVFIVGKKDMADNPRFRVGLTKRDKRPTYYQHYDANIPLESYKKHGYLVVAPHQEIDVGGEEMSGTRLRTVLPASTPEQFEDIMGFDDPYVSDMLRRKLRIKDGN